MTKLRLSPDLSLPIEAVTEAIGFLGRRGSGKSYAAQKLAEQFHYAGAQFVALDPVGNWWALRLAADGKSPGLPITIFGGLQGDIPIDASAGQKIADIIVDRRISAVIDVSQFESDAWEMRRDRIHIFGTKRAGRDRDVPLVRKPDAPPLSRDRFEKAFRARFAKVLTPYQLRRTYAQWMEESGIPRTRRQLYMGHGTKDITDLYERYQVEEFLAADAKKLKAFLAPPKKAKVTRGIKLA